MNQTPALDPRARLGLPNGGQPVPTRRTEPVYDPLAARRVTHAELEASLEAYFNKQVRLLGGRLVKLVGEKGLPDRLVLLPGGRLYLVELKTDTGRVSAAQDLWHQRAAQLGTRVAVLYGRTAIDRWLREVAAVQPGEKRDQLNPSRATGTRK